MKVEFSLNGRMIESECGPGLTLLEFLRSRELYSVKHGCDHGECGSCTVLLDDKAMNACLLLVAAVQGKAVETLEGLEQSGRLRALQDAFLDTGAVQCGFCTPGMLLSIEALLRKDNNPSESRIRDALTGNLCRCTGYVKPVAAVHRMVEESR